MRRYISILIITLLLLSCSQNTYKAANRSYKKQAKGYAKILSSTPEYIIDSLTQAPEWVGTVNFNMRRPNFIILHHTAQKSCDLTLKAFTMVKSQVSAHYVICKNGIVHHMLNDYLRAWHAGAGSWGNTSDVNSSSIGIELDNNGNEPFSDAQVNSLLHLLASLKKSYNIPVANFIGHADIAPGRKNDPNVYFPWKKLAEKGFGYWYGDTSKIIVPNGFDNIQALRIIGYNVSDTSAAIKSFKRKFLQKNNDAILSNGDRKILYDLMKKSL